MDGRYLKAIVIILTINNQYLEYISAVVLIVNRYLESIVVKRHIINRYQETIVVIMLINDRYQLIVIEIRPLIKLINYSTINLLLIAFIFLLTRANILHKHSRYICNCLNQPNMFHVHHSMVYRLDSMILLNCMKAGNLDRYTFLSLNSQ